MQANNIRYDAIDNPRNRHERRASAVHKRRDASKYWQNRRRKTFKMLFGIKTQLGKRIGFCRICDDGIHRGQQYKDIEGLPHETHVKAHKECIG